MEWEDSYKVVKFLWHDPTSIDAWDDLQDAIEYQPHIILTSGILLSDGEDNYVVCTNFDLSALDSVSGVMIVPKRNIIEGSFEVVGYVSGA